MSKSRVTKAELVELLRVAKRNEELRKLQLFMFRFPKLVEMSVWAAFGNESTGLLINKTEPRCGSVGCLAGLTVALSLPQGLTPEIEKEIEKQHEQNRNYSDYSDTGEQGIPSKAARLLNLTNEEADLLFFPSNWPYEFRERLEEFDTDAIETSWNPKDSVKFKKANARSLKEQKAYVDLIIERIDYFITEDE